MEIYYKKIEEILESNNVEFDQPFRQIDTFEQLIVFLNGVNQSHVNIEIEDYYIRNYNLGIKVNRNYELIENIYDKKYNGYSIKEINGISLNTFLKKIYPYANISFRHPKHDEFITMLLIQQFIPIYTLTLEKGEEEIKIDTSYTDKMDILSDPVIKSVKKKNHITINSFVYEENKKFLVGLLKYIQVNRDKYDKWIIDLSYNPGGTMLYAMLLTRIFYSDNSLEKSFINDIDCFEKEVIDEFKREHKIETINKNTYLGKVEFKFDAYTNSSCVYLMRMFLEGDGNYMIKSDEFYNYYTTTEKSNIILDGYMSGIQSGDAISKTYKLNHNMTLIYPTHIFGKILKPFCIVSPNFVA